MRSKTIIILTFAAAFIVCLIIAGLMVLLNSPK